MLIKRIFDILLALFLLVFLLLPLFLIWLMCTFDTKQNGLFVQARIGKAGKRFNFYKFRTLLGKPSSSVTNAQEHKMSLWGKWLRKSKLDEIPQLINVLKGDMSFVGPRPDVPGYADQLKGDDRIILNVLPGITGPAQIKYKNEYQILSTQPNPKAYNDQVIWPDKVAINKKYVQEWSFKKDIIYLFKTIF